METEETQQPADQDVRQMFGQAVRDARIRLGWTQEALAEQLNERGGSFTQTMIAKVERGARPTPFEECALFSRVLGVSLDSLVAPQARHESVLLLNRALDARSAASSELYKAAQRFDEAGGELSMYLMAVEMDSTVRDELDGDGLRRFDNAVRHARRMLEVTAVDVASKAVENWRKNIGDQSGLD